MKYIIGLGNPGEKYRYTRHNIAWIIFDTLHGGVNWKYDKYMNAQLYGDILGLDIGMYIKPQTFMNRSGEIASHIKKQKDFLPEDIVIIYDDLDLVFGTIRISYNRGDGGHNGIKSLTQHLGTKKTIRIRVGIALVTKEGKQIKPNVLSHFSDKERKKIQEDLSPRIREILLSLQNKGLEKTMNEYNKK